MIPRPSTHTYTDALAARMKAGTAHERAVVNQVPARCLSRVCDVFTFNTPTDGEAPGLVQIIVTGVGT